MVVSVLALSITSFLSFSYSDQILRERAGAQLSGESSIRGDSVLFLLNTRMGEVQTIASDPEIGALVEGAVSSGGTPAASEFVEQLRAFEHLTGSEDLEGLVIAGADGRVLFERGNVGDHTGNPLLIRALKGGTSDFVPWEDGKRLLVAAPLAPAGGGSVPAGVVMAQLATSGIDEILLDRSGLGETGEVYMVDDDYMMISESRFIEGAVFSQVVETHATTECFEKGIDSSGLYDDYRGVLIYGSAFCAKDMGFVLIAEIDEAETVQPIKTLEGRILQTGIAIMVGMSVLTLVLARSLTGPLIKLRNAANDIAHGNYDVSTSISSRDEIGDLSTSFDYMARRLKESLEEIRAKDSVIRQQEDMLLSFSEQSQEYCVCMVDMRDSTRIAAALSEPQTIDFYQTFLNSMAEIVRGHGGITIKNIGDALLFSFPNLHPDTLEVFQKTMECCLDMGDAHGEISKKLTGRGLPAVSYRISATYGPVQLAKISTSSVNDIFGPTVNRCAKINRAAPPNGLVVGAEFHRNARSMPGFAFAKSDKGSGGFDAYIVTRAG
ncbi:adenylate cyclase [Cenarchaeum symbiosum A]|uniref:histidine kinase n=1 Tax=Cenarchaeum symbiosum (strain A) TaxID=414004 RepID=A0RW41_CENSY|nr:adenylate cyclase [Cenarchaeum symbiosum A]